MDDNIATLGLWIHGTGSNSGSYSRHCRPGAMEQTLKPKVGVAKPSHTRPHVHGRGEGLPT